MKDLTWSEKPSVGVDEIDDDHRRLVNLFNLFAHENASGENPDYLEAILEELISNTLGHFRHEERFMLKHGYEDLDAHKDQHQQLFLGVDEIRDKFHR